MEGANAAHARLRLITKLTTLRGYCFHAFISHFKTTQKPTWCLVFFGFLLASNQILKAYKSTDLQSNTKKLDLSAAKEPMRTKKYAPGSQGFIGSTVAGS